MEDSKQNTRYAVVNSDGLVNTVKDTKEEAEQEAKQMKDYHQQDFNVIEY